MTTDRGEETTSPGFWARFRSNLELLTEAMEADPVELLRARITRLEARVVELEDARGSVEPIPSSGPDRGH